MDTDSGALAGGAGNLKRLAALRWFVLAGQLAVIGLAGPLLDIELPVPPMLSILGLLAAFNALTLRRLRRPVAVTDGELFMHLCVDVTGLTALLFFSGGAANPFVSLYLLPVTIAAAVLAGRHAWALSGLALTAYSMLDFLYVPLAIANPARATQLHLAGMWMIFAASTGLITWFVARMTAAIRARDRELAAAREEALRTERIVALGSLAAGAAHELGTPLATMAVVSGELVRRPGLAPEVRDELRLLAGQIEQCKAILTGLSAQAGQVRAEGGRAVALDAWLDRVIRRWRELRPQAGVTVRIQGAGRAPLVLGEAVLEQALINLFDNAADASPEAVEIAAQWEDAGGGADGVLLKLEVADRGPGMDPRVLADGGRNFITTRPDGTGIGLFLARAAIERFGGRIVLANRSRGAIARIELPLASLRAERT
ncbi:MAG: ATP-binding protein [Rhodocyclaceae bacterium]